jgi:hypothetical protein
VSLLRVFAASTAKNTSSFYFVNDLAQRYQTVPNFKVKLGTAIIVQVIK